MKNLVQSTAQKMFNRGFTASYSVQKSWDAIQLREILKTNIVQFTFAKKDGTMTTKTGTLHSSYLPPIPEGYKPKAKKVESPKVSFWSIPDNGFRSFLPENLVRIEEVNPIN